MPIFKTGLSMLVLASALAISPLSAVSAGQPEPVYWITYFSDATMTQPVGSIEQFCASWGVGENALIGQTSPYESRILLGHCQDGQLVWLPG